MTFFSIDIPRWAIAFGLLGLIAGCSGGGDTPELADVSGRVTFDGSPLSEATVIFQPDAGRPSAGKTDTDGNYELKYTSRNSGAKVGKHKVIISKEISAPGRGGESVWKETVPATYNQDTTLTAEVTAGHNEHNFDLLTEG